MTLLYVPADGTRTSQTSAGPNKTLASPTVGGTTTLSVWRVAMAAGQEGPRHTIDSEQVWTLLTGRASIRSDTEDLAVTAGDTVIMPADAVRAVTAVADCEFLVCGSPAALASIPGSDAEPVSPPWIR